jgi:hypothetical protein
MLVESRWGIENYKHVIFFITFFKVESRWGIFFIYEQKWGIGVLKTSLKCTNWDNFIV